MKSLSSGLMYCLGLGTPQERSKAVDMLRYELMAEAERRGYRFHLHKAQTKSTYFHFYGVPGIPPKMEEICVRVSDHTPPSKYAGTYVLASCCLSGQWGSAAEIMDIVATKMGYITRVPPNVYTSQTLAAQRRFSY